MYHPQTTRVARTAVAIAPIVDAGAADARTADSGLCTNIGNAAALVSQMRAAEDPPHPIGGSLYDGVYLKTADTLFTGVGGVDGPTGLTERETVVITHAARGTATLESVLIEDDGPTQAERLTLTPTTGSRAELKFVCPGKGSLELDYSVRIEASAVVLDLYTQPDRVETFTRDFP